MLADVVDAVVGVDTHRDTHQVEIAHPTGAPIATCTIDNTGAGYAQLLGWISEHAAGPRVAVSIEGTRSYGLGLARAIAAAGLLVLECEQPSRKARRGRGKSDAIDAHLAVLFALQLDTGKLPSPRADGDREALRILLSARDELTTGVTAHTNRLRALLRDGGDSDRDLARGSLTVATLAALARRRCPRDADRVQAIRQAEIRRLALALRDQRRELQANRAQLADIVHDLAPGLTDQCGIGPISAAQVIVSFSHTGRCRNDAAFAALAGTSPIEASSGRSTRHRLNRGGDRALNRAIHTIANTRMRSDPATRDYVARRTAEGKSSKEIRRCIKRYITRQLYRSLTASELHNRTIPKDLDNT
ncbi:IS110 family transposase [Nocardia sp. GAS34]|uniref:IS110 family transposase n=1 Tax=unclassified Nocardia TaxID=2637762 RepID=UPI003D20B09D